MVAGDFVVVATNKVIIKTLLWTSNYPPYFNDNDLLFVGFSLFNLFLVLMLELKLNYTILI